MCVQFFHSCAGVEARPADVGFYNAKISGEMGKDYINSVTSCLEDALTDRDLVHRQTACSIVKHLALGTAGLGQEDANLHLMNLVWPVCSNVLFYSLLSRASRAW